MSQITNQNDHDMHTQQSKPYVISMFPTPVYSVLDEQMAKKMLPLAKKYLSDKSELNHTFIYKSTYKLTGGLEVYDDMKEFRDYVINRAKEFSEILGDTPEESLKAHIFASEMTKGDSHPPHVHPNNVYSGILYLQVPDNSSSLFFLDPRNNLNRNPSKKQKYTQYNSPQACITPQPGLFLIWNSWLEHYVPPNQTDGQRITLVFNIHN